MKKYCTLLLFSIILFGSCKEKKNSEEVMVKNPSLTATPFFKISLAEWSLHDPIIKGDMSPLDFAEKASEMNFKGIEYVSQLYSKELEKYDTPEVAMDTLLKILKRKSEEFNVKNVLIMVDLEGNLSSIDDKERGEAVDNHKKWVDAAAFLGCHSIRVNLIGAAQEEDWKEASIKGLSELCDYAATKNIGVIVENHGGFSSNAKLLMQVIEQVDKSNCGTLPDFGNFCLRREDGSQWDSPCAEEYPRYEGIAEMMSKAKGVSAKTFAFNPQGEETSMDYIRILQTVKDAGYTGFIGIEYEGKGISPEEGIKRTRELLISSAQKLK